MEKMEIGLAVAGLTDRYRLSPSGENPGIRGQVRKNTFGENMTTRSLLLLPEFQKFITASSTGRRRMPSGKKLSGGTLVQYRSVLLLLREFEIQQEVPLRIQLLHRVSMRVLQKEKNYWARFFRQFSLFLYRKKNCCDQYAGSVFKVIKTFFRYLALDKALPVGEYYRKFRVPSTHFNPVILTPAQLRFLITDPAFERTLSPSLKRVKDIFVFGCTVALRYGDLAGLRKSNIHHGPGGTYVVLHTRKTGSEIRVPLPGYARDIVTRYSKKAGAFVLPRLSCTNLNLGIKALVKKAGWDHPLPKIRHRQGVAVEMKTRKGETCRFYDHMTAHTMRRTAITTLLMLGVDEQTVRRISGHAPGSKEFYRYVVVVQEYLDARVKEAHQKLIAEGGSADLNPV